MLKAIARRIASSQLQYAWSETDVRIDTINDVQEGVDQEMAATHHDLDEQDMDMTTKDKKEALPLNLPSHKL